MGVQARAGNAGRKQDMKNQTLALRTRAASLGSIAASLLFLAMTASVLAGPGPWSAARTWDEQLLQAIRIDRPRPPVHARNLYHTSVAMYDAWAAYDTVSDQVLHHERLSSVDAEAARAQAISFAAYRVLKHRFLTGPGAVATQAALDAQMDALGYDRNFISTVGNTPAALGNRVAATIIAAGFADGSNEANNYAPTNGYEPVNEPLIIALPGTVMVDPNHWQPLAFDYYVKQNGQVVGAAVQAFVCPHWLAVTPFSLTPADKGANTYFDPGPPPRLGSSTDAQFKAEVVQVIRFSSRVDPADGVMIDISPSAIGNTPVGENTGTGHALNPVTGLPYPPNIVKRADSLIAFTPAPHSGSASPASSGTPWQCRLAGCVCLHRTATTTR
jgi:hypothetical protein